ncbi:EAL domain-containing protein [Bosea sp. TWI1241]|uniref:putative bifunctional diguanylate cyclase/phosphodiesterase n=1 Tax=Bosea sp. TWI1241 TaxID=3148904 RepID=UPI003209D992
MTNAESSARLLTGTIASLAGAFVVVLAAAVALAFGIMTNANDLEAARQNDRLDAAMNAEVLLRRDNLRTVRALKPLLDAGLPHATLQWSFSLIAERLLEFDGSFLVTAAGRLLAGVENGRPATQAGYDALRRLKPGLPGGNSAGQLPPAGHPPPLPLFSIVNDNGQITSIVVATIADDDIVNAATREAAFVVGYRRATPARIAALGHRHRIDDLHVVTDKPSDALLRRPIPSPDGQVAAWLTWQASRPGDAMLPRFAWALGIVAILLSSIFAYVCRRLGHAAQQIALRERQIQRLAGQDELSRLPNRRTFDRRLDQEIAQLDRKGSPLAVLLIDLDRFKAVNDTYGHNAGDELVRQVAGRLAAMLRIGDTVARLGGDEFGIIMTHLGQPGDSAALAQRILDTLAEPFEVGGVTVSIGCSIGIAHAPQDGKDRATLMRRADAALYQAKNEGRNRYAFFETQMNAALQMKRTVEDELRSAIARDELTLHYQPQVSIDGTKIIGLEALVRWPHPVHGMIPPSEFIPIAEERGLIMPLSEWVLRRACEQARHWPGVKLAVNVSPIQFRHKDFVASVIRILDETGFDPARLELELTEGVLVDDADAAENAMMDLRSHGVSLALDDFGTGYSSLIYLRRFAFDKIKIDRSFLEYMEATGESAILVHSVVHLGRALGLRVCAEGVETPEQHRFLQAVGCHELQGFLFSRPVPAEAIDTLLARESPFAATQTAA